MKKILARVLIISMFVSGVFFLKPAPKADAIFGIGDISFDPSNLIPNLLSYGEELFSNLIESSLKVAIKKIADKVLDKLVQDTLNWANGGFDGDPGFVNNWDDFLKGTKHEVISSSFANATQVANGLLPENTGGNPENQAQQNYNVWSSGEVSSSRAVARTIAIFGAKQLNYDALNSIINGEGETLSKLLGSQEQKNAFGSDFKAGGIMGYIALADPNNSSLGLQGLVENNLSQKTNEKVTNVIDNIQTPQKFLDKTQCSDGTKPENGVCPEGTRVETVTPGDQVGTAVGDSLKSEKEKATMADGLVDSLVKAIGDLTDGLLDAGISGLTNSAGKAFFGQQEAIDEFSGGEFGASGYQSGYDVLGISSDIELNGGTGGTGTGGGTGGVDNSGIFVGGPEDATGGYGTRPQIIVDFEQELELNINFLLEEQKYYGELRRMLIKSTDVLYEFDKCIPGADYDWEQRYKDNMSLNGNEPVTVDDEVTEDVNASHKIGFNEQRTMVEDPKVTIPGGVTLMNQHRNILKITQNNSVENGSRLAQINSSIAALEYIRQSVLEEFNQQRIAFDAPLVLFASQWNEETYSEQNKIESLKAAEKNGYFISVNLQSGVMSDEQARQALLNDEEKAMKAVLKMSWEIWRKETDSGVKLELRKAFYVTRTKFSSEDLVASAKIKADQVGQAISNAYKLALDCMVFKMYALGISRNYIAGIVFNSSQIEEKVLESAAVINQYDPIDAGTTTDVKGNIIKIGGAIAGGPITAKIGQILFGDKAELHNEYFNVEKALSNEAILSFLESEYALREQNLPSVFSTSNMISPRAISESILGFESNVERNKYFNLYYPEIMGPMLPEDGSEIPQGGVGPFGQQMGQRDSFPRGGIYGRDYLVSNKFNIKDMYRVDRIFSVGNRIQKGMRGTLFCRTPGYMEIVNNDGDSHDIMGSRCYNTYYTASKLDYKLLISGINQGLSI